MQKSQLRELTLNEIHKVSGGNLGSEYVSDSGETHIVTEITVDRIGSDGRYYYQAWGYAGELAFEGWDDPGYEGTLSQAEIDAYYYG